MKESERARVVAGKYQLEKLLGQGGMGEVWVATDLARGGKIALNATAVLILRRLMDASPGSVTRDELNALLWGDMPPASDPLRMHIYELRRALSGAFGAPLIKTVRGFGYRFEADHGGA